MSKRTDTIRSLFTGGAPPVEVKSAAPPDGGLSADNPASRRPAVTVNAVRGAFADIERENAALRAMANSGDRVVDIAVDVIDPSPFPDRFLDPEDESFVELKQSISERGQEVPVLLRPHPGHPGRYQTAYGHRRVRALGELGRPVRAVVRELSDDDLAAAQGVENAARTDLSYIERAVFALRLEDAGRSRAVVQQALTIDKAAVSKLIAVARAIPADVVAAIGRAPRTGRPRWLELADAIGKAQALPRVQQLIGTQEFKLKASDARFLAVLAAARHSPAKALLAKPVRTTIKSVSGEEIARVTDGAGASLISIDRSERAGFADFLIRELPDLFERFQSVDAPVRSGRR
jgi:ParB family transcriptional regulator, chromosome partitioning protein